MGYCNSLLQAGGGEVEGDGEEVGQAEGDAGSGDGGGGGGGGGEAGLEVAQMGAGPAGPGA